MELGEASVVSDGRAIDVLAVNEALERLMARDERLGRIVEYRFFGGMAEAEIAEALGVSTRTVERDWKRARAYLHTMLVGSPPERDGG